VVKNAQWKYLIRTILLCHAPAISRKARRSEQGSSAGCWTVGKYYGSSLM
jgi:hypothetical protein